MAPSRQAAQTAQAAQAAATLPSQAPQQPQTRGRHIWPSNGNTLFDTEPWGKAFTHYGKDISPCRFITISGSVSSGIAVAMQRVHAAGM